MPEISVSPGVLPGPRSVPLLGPRGNKLLFYRDPVAYHHHVYKTYGPIAAFAQGRAKVLIYDPAYNQAVLSQPEVFQKGWVAVPGPLGSALHRLGAGFTVLNGEEHRQCRRLIMPAFHKQQVDTYCETMAATTTQVLDRWRIGETFDIADQMQTLALCVASKTLFGLDALEQAESIARLLARWLDTMASMSVQLFPINLPGMPYHNLLKLSERLEAQLGAVINHERTHPPKTQTVLTLLLNARDEQGNGFTDHELISHSAILFFGGFETTATAMTWILFLLAQHPETLADVLDELQSNLGGAAPGAEALGRLPLLEMVIKEGMRLLPPAIHAGRIGVQPFTLGPYEFPAGTKVMYSQYITHRIADLYPQPQRFLPRRWETISPSPYAYLPFLAGPRMCIGATFAMVEMKIMLALILQRYRLSLLPNTQVDRKVKYLLKTKNGIPMQVHPQDRLFRKVPVLGTIHEMVDLV